MKGHKSRFPHRTEGQFVFRSQASDEDIQGSKLYWKTLDVDQKLAALRFKDATLVERVVAAQREMCRSDLQCYMLGIRGQDAVREKVGMNNFAIIAEDGGQSMEFMAKAEFVERDDLFEYMEAELGTPFLKGRPVLPRQKWHTLLDRVPSSWGEFLRQVFMLAELAILDAYQSSAQTSKINSKESLRTTTEPSGSVSNLTDEQIADMLQDAPSESIMSKCAKRKARKKRQALSQGKNDEDESMLGESVTESVTEASSITMADSTMDSLVSTRYALQSTNASTGVDDDSVSISTMDTAMGSARAAEHVEHAELQVDWSTAEPDNPATPLEVLQEFVELEVDWHDDQAQPEERWSAGMVDAFTGVRAEWHWVTTPCPMLTCGNLRAHIKNTFVADISDSNELPEELRRAKSAPAPRRRKSSR